MPKKSAAKKSRLTPQANAAAANRKGAQRVASRVAAKQGTAKQGTAKQGTAKKAAPQRATAKNGSPKRAPSKKVEAIPQRYGSVTPYLVVSPCAAALEYYVKAFGAKQVSSMPGPGGKVMHAEMKIGGSIVMLSDEMPPMPGQPDNRKSPKNAGATTASVMLYVKDIDAVFDRAVAAGGKANLPPQDMFWGDRYGEVEDPFGHVWSLATHQRDVSAREMKKAMAQMSAPPA